MGILGFFKKIGRGIGKVASGVGKAIGSVAGKVGRGIGDVIKHPEKIGQAITQLPALAEKVLEKAPIVGNIPIVGQAVKMLSKAEKIKDIGQALGKGDVAGALRKGGEIAVGSLPGVSDAVTTVKTLEQVGRGVGRVAGRVKM